MTLFTFVVDYAGGTYISQSNGRDHLSAFQSWLARMVPDEIADGVSLDIYAALSNEHSEDLVPLTGQLGVWCTTGEAANGVVLVNIVRTDPQI